jgi:3-mercaptopropionate dioxygenase
MSVTTSGTLQTSGRCPATLTDAIRHAVRQGAGWDKTAALVADALRDNLPSAGGLAGILTQDQLRGDPAGYQTHLVHAEADGSFSIAAMVWLPGQRTSVHDHVTWCVTGVVQGAEYEEIFDSSLRVVARNTNPAGTVSGFAPPGDIHRVTNCGTDVAVSMHVYGADVSRLGSSIRREYALPG